MHHASDLATTAAFSLRVLVPGVLASIATTGCDIVTADLKAAATRSGGRPTRSSRAAGSKSSNVNGRIHVEPSEGSQVEIVAQKKARGVSEDAAKEAAERIEIKETSPARRSASRPRCRARAGMLRGSAEVTYTVRVPAGAEVKFTTVNGGIEMSRLSGQDQRRNHQRRHRRRERSAGRSTPRRPTAASTSS